MQDLRSQKSQIICKVCHLKPEKVLSGVGKNFRLLMQWCHFFVFFSSDLFMKILHPKGPLRAQRHQNSMTGMLETQPKLAQKWPKFAKNSHFSTFFDFLKNCPYDWNKIFYSHSTPH